MTSGWRAEPDSLPRCVAHHEDKRRVTLGRTLTEAGYNHLASAEGARNPLKRRRRDHEQVRIIPSDGGQTLTAGGAAGVVTRWRIWRRTAHTLDRATGNY